MAAAIRARGSLLPRDTPAIRAQPRRRGGATPRRAALLLATLAAGACTLAAALRWTLSRPARAGSLDGRIVGASIGLGHRLFDGGAALHGGARFPAPTREETAAVVIVGGGIAGLTAGWRLVRAGLTDVLLLELESSLGGNAKSGAMGVDGGEPIAHPWAAHYLPLPPRENVPLRALLEEAGAILGYRRRADGSVPTAASAAVGEVRWRRSLLCEPPVESMFAPGAGAGGGGAWLLSDDGALPTHLMTPAEHAQLGAFRQAVGREVRGQPHPDPPDSAPDSGPREAAAAALRARLREASAAAPPPGPAARARFTLPISHCLVDARARALDAASAAAWLDAVGVRSERLRWWLEYAMRDDYGVPLGEASAWAFVHYFAARDTDARLEGPDGNGWLVRHLAAALGERARTRAAVHAVRPLPAAEGGGVAVEYFDAAGGSSVRVRARRVIYAAPRFTARHTVPGYDPPFLRNFTYAPWVVANVGLRRPPRGGAHTCDNLIYNGPGGVPAAEGGGGLGYTVTSVQAGAALRERAPWAAALWPPAWPARAPAVLTHYTALSARTPAEARALMLARGTDWEYWAERVLSELEAAHPDIRALATRVDVLLLAHAMVRPTPGFVWGEARQQAARPHAGVVHWAHSDMAGLSLLEEAFAHGTRAADDVLLALTGSTAGAL